MRTRKLVPYGWFLLWITGIQAAVADPCEPTGNPPASIEILVGEPTCSPDGWPACRDIIAARDEKVLQIEGVHGEPELDPFNIWEIKVAFDVSGEPLVAVELSIDLPLLEPIDNHYYWYDDAVLVCDGEDVVAWPSYTACPLPGGVSYLVLKFHFPPVPDRCISMDGGKETVRVLWRGKMLGDHSLGSDYRDVDRIGIDP